MTPTLLILGSERTLFTDSTPEGAPFEGEPEDDWLVSFRGKSKIGSPSHFDCSGGMWKRLRALARVDEKAASILEQFLENQVDLLDLPPGQMRDRLLGKPEPTEEEKAQRRATMAELFANLKPGTVHIPSRLHDADLPGRFLETHKALQDFEDASRVDDLDGFPEEQAKRFWPDLVAPSVDDLVQEFSEYEETPDDAFPWSVTEERGKAIPEGFRRWQDTFDAGAGVPWGEFVAQKPSAEALRDVVQESVFDVYGPDAKVEVVQTEPGDGRSYRFTLSFPAEVWPTLSDSARETAIRLGAKVPAGSMSFMVNGEVHSYGAPEERQDSVEIKAGIDGILLSSGDNCVRVADADEVAAQLARYREGFEALEPRPNWWKPEDMDVFAIGVDHGDKKDVGVLVGIRDGELYVLDHEERSFAKEEPKPVAFAPVTYCTGHNCLNPAWSGGLCIDHMRAAEPPQPPDEWSKPVEGQPLPLFHVSTSPDLLLQALYRWGEKNAGERLSVSPKLFAVLDSRCFPDGRSVLAKFLATARMVQPYFSVEVDVFGLTGEEILAGETWPRREGKT